MTRKKIVRRPAARKARRSNTSASSVASLATFIAKVGDLGSGLVLFRGDRRSKKPLLPRIATEDLRLNSDVLEAEREMLRGFRIRAHPHLERVPDSDWQWLALAQHHGLPTRLLDWTDNPLVALWFAVSRPAYRPPTGGPHDGVVWVYEATPGDSVDTSADKDPFALSRTRVYQPEYIDARIQHQSGWFTVHKHLDGDRFIPLEKQKLQAKKLTRILIAHGAFADIRHDLDRCGINAATVLADLGGLCEHLQWLHSKIADENPQQNARKAHKAKGNRGV